MRKNDNRDRGASAVAGIPERSKGAGSRSAVKDFAGSNPAPCTKSLDDESRLEPMWAVFRKTIGVSNFSGALKITEYYS